MPRLGSEPSQLEFQLKPITNRSPNKREFTQVCVGILSKSQTKNVNIALVFEDAADAARLESTSAPLQDRSYIYLVL